jgi:dihydrolipoamide dehydrogenase
MVVGETRIEVDLLVLGAGPGGYVAAIRAAQLGKSVTVVDKGPIGGVCLNVGCIPSKALISAAHQYETVSHAGEIGISVEGVKVDFAKIQEWKSGIVNKLTGGVNSLFKGNKVQFVSGEAFFTEADEVRVVSGYEGARYKFKDCIIATGSRPFELKSLPFGKRILSSTEALALTELPKSMIVVGGGYIGIELGQAFAKFGTQLTVLEGGKVILPGFEEEATKLVARNLKKLNVDIVTEALAQSAVQTDQDVTITYTVNGEEKQATAEYVLVTVGRKPNTDDLGLDVIKLKTDERGLIPVNEQGQTEVPHIYAIGDVVPGLSLAHKASYEGKVAAEAIAGHPSAVDYTTIPAVVFSDPEIAGVGLTEAQAKADGIDVIVGKFPYAGNGRALSMNAGEGFVKLIAEKSTGVVLGGIIAGGEASNLIAEIGLAIEMGTTLEDIALTIHAHPTLGEIVMETAEVALGQAIHQMNKS